MGPDTARKLILESGRIGERTWPSTSHLADLAIAHFEDLTPCTYQRFNPARRNLVLAVGWLQRGYEFNRGDVPERVLDRLAEFAITPMPQPGGVFAGHHECDLCPERIESKYPPARWHFRSSSHRNLYIPFEGRVYVSPESVGHYITEHGYCPPEPFLNAVESCPAVDGEEYREQTWRFFRLTSQDLGPGFTE